MHRRFDHFIHIVLQTAFIVDGWSHEWELKQITFGGGTRVFRVLAVFRPVVTASTCTASTASTRSSPIILSYAQCTGNVNYIPTIYLRTAVSIVSSAFYCKQHSLLTDGRTNGSRSKILSCGELVYLEYWQYFESIRCEHSKYLRVQHS